MERGRGEKNGRMWWGGRDRKRGEERLGRRGKGERVREDRRD